MLSSLPIEVVNYLAKLNAVVILWGKQPSTLEYLRRMHRIKWVKIIFSALTKI